MRPNHHVERTLSDALTRLGRLHRRLADVLFRPLGVHAGQDALLRELWRLDGQSQGDLSTCLAVRSPTTAKIVTRLVRAGLVARAKDGGDSRRALVFLTAKGRALQPACGEVWHDLEQRTVEGLTLEEQALLRRLLAIVEKSLARYT